MNPDSRFHSRSALTAHSPPAPGRGESYNLTPINCSTFSTYLTLSLRPGSVRRRPGPRLIPLHSPLLVLKLWHALAVDKPAHVQTLSRQLGEYGVVVGMLCEEITVRKKMYFVDPTRGNSCFFNHKCEDLKVQMNTHTCTRTCTAGEELEEL